MGLALDALIAAGSAAPAAAWEEAMALCGDAGDAEALPLRGVRRALLAAAKAAFPCHSVAWDARV
jgi:hypothetical protein